MHNIRPLHIPPYQCQCRADLVLGIQRHLLGEYVLVLLLIVWSQVDSRFLIGQVLLHLYNLDVRLFLPLLRRLLPVEPRIILDSVFANGDQ